MHSFICRRTVPVAAARLRKTRFVCGHLERLHAAADNNILFLFFFCLLRQKGTWMNSKSWDNCVTLFSVFLLVGRGYEAVSFSGVSNTIRLSLAASIALLGRHS